MSWPSLLSYLPAVFLMIKSLTYLLVNHEFRAIGGSITVDISVNSDIGDLKEKVKEERPDIFSFHRITSESLIVWKTATERVLEVIEHREEALERVQVDINDENTIQRLEKEVKVTDLQLSGGEILLVQLPGMLCLYYCRLSSVSSDMLNEDILRLASIVRTPIPGMSCILPVLL